MDGFLAPAGMGDPTVVLPAAATPPEGLGKNEEWQGVPGGAR
jgi:hypothetical protein